MKALSEITARCFFSIKIYWLSERKIVTDLKKL
nr:MAG TPA: hypothetical protein [Caudoviricetes sp.]